MQSMNTSSCTAVVRTTYLDKTSGLATQIRSGNCIRYYMHIYYLHR